MGQLSKYQKWVFILPLIAVFIWSLNIAVTRYVADYISPASISFYRWFVAFIILTPFMLPTILMFSRAMWSMALTAVEISSSCRDCSVAVPAMA